MAKIRKAMTSWPQPVAGRQRVACHFCDTLHQAPAIAEGTAARCRRCGVVLYQNRPASLVRVTAFSLASLILLVVVHSFPFLTMKAGGMQTELSLARAAGELIKAGSVTIGCAVGLFTIVAPLVMAGGMLYVNAPLLIGHAAPGARVVARWTAQTEPWNMIEVFLLGVLVSMMKLGTMAELVFGAGFWAFAALMLCMAAAMAGIDRNELWDRLEVAGE
jgi:paraquat-inducible protein A